MAIIFYNNILKGDAENKLLVAVEAEITKNLRNVCERAKTAKKQGSGF